MGADLIGYMVIGPREISLDKVGEATTFAKNNIIKISNAATSILEGEEEVIDEAWASISEFDIQDYEINDYADFDEKSAEDYSARLVGDLLDFWKNGSRDSAYRDLPNGSRVVFAGDQTWGDTPDGFGYQTLRKSEAIGLLKFFGIE